MLFGGEALGGDYEIRLWGWGPQDSLIASALITRREFILHHVSPEKGGSCPQARKRALLETDSVGILDIQPPTLWEINMSWLNHPACGVLSWQPQLSQIPCPPQNAQSWLHTHPEVTCYSSRHCTLLEFYTQMESCQHIINAIHPRILFSLGSVKFFKKSASFHLQWDFLFKSLFKHFLLCDVLALLTEH